MNTRNNSNRKKRDLVMMEQRETDANKKISQKREKEINNHEEKELIKEIKDLKSETKKKDFLGKAASILEHQIQKSGKILKIFQEEAPKINLNNLAQDLIAKPEYRRTGIATLTKLWNLQRNEGNFKYPKNFSKSTQKFLLEATKTTDTEILENLFIIFDIWKNDSMEFHSFSNEIFSFIENLKIDDLKGKNKNSFLQKAFKLYYELFIDTNHRPDKEEAYTFFLTLSKLLLVDSALSTKLIADINSTWPRKALRFAQSSKEKLKELQNKLHSAELAGFLIREAEDKQALSLYTNELRKLFIEKLSGIKSYFLLEKNPNTIGLILKLMYIDRYSMFGPEAELSQKQAIGLKSALQWLKTSKELLPDQLELAKSCMACLQYFHREKLSMAFNRTFCLKNDSISEIETGVARVVDSYSPEYNSYLNFLLSPYEVDRKVENEVLQTKGYRQASEKGPLFTFSEYIDPEFTTTISDVFRAPKLNEILSADKNKTIWASSQEFEPTAAVSGIRNGRIEFSLQTDKEREISEICFCDLKSSEKSKSSSFTFSFSQEVLPGYFIKTFLLRMFSSNLKILKTMNIGSIVSNFGTKQNRVEGLENLYLKVLYTKNPKGDPYKYLCVLKQKSFCMIDFFLGILVDSINLKSQCGAIKTVGDRIVIGSVAHEILIFSFKKKILEEEKKILLPDSAKYFFEVRGPERLGIVFKYFGFVVVVKIGDEKAGEEEDQVLLGNRKNAFNKFVYFDEKFEDLVVQTEEEIMNLSLDL